MESDDPVSLWPELPPLGGRFEVTVRVPLAPDEPPERVAAISCAPGVTGVALAREAVFSADVSACDVIAAFAMGFGAVLDSAGAEMIMARGMRAEVRPL